MGSEMCIRDSSAIEAGVNRHYGVTTLPTMSTGATDMAYPHNRGIQCYGIGPAIDLEGAALGFGVQSDQERILISELNRFVRFKWDVVIDLAARQQEFVSKANCFNHRGVDQVSIARADRQRSLFTTIF